MLLRLFDRRCGLHRTQKILPKKWQTYRDESNSLCQMIFKKIPLPCGVNGQMYWDGMLVATTNDKFCLLRLNFKQELFEQFQGKFWACFNKMSRSICFFFIYYLQRTNKQDGVPQVMIMDGFLLEFKTGLKFMKS